MTNKKIKQVILVYEDGSTAGYNWNAFVTKMQDQLRVALQERGIISENVEKAGYWGH